MSHLDIKEPFIYFVDSFTSLANNAIWWNLRKSKEDIIIDANGNFLTQEEIKQLIL